MAKFKKGDRVVLHGNSSNPHLSSGMKGTILEEAKPGDVVGVEFDAYFQGHSCQGMGKNGHCWNVAPQDLRKTTSRRTVKPKARVVPDDFLGGERNGDF